MLATALAAKLLRRLGHHARAVESFASLLATQEKVLGNDHAEVCSTKEQQPAAGSRARAQREKNKRTEGL
jgi:hypothetical protein